ncbi:SRPBCC family protein [Proteiniclasticum sp. SCR006]|uniref:SRPBCC family protein n=1 Tax=Proteiniclasticum aestuarii TaxID=2817862 RepID=A0A939KM30_9CLOT|nr:SRPBCC family protein [Proteiniclasticum aestuarii]MBO1266265.1 SRPBCC family protein [Proteiniclasticum aestuarii]
MKYKVEVMIGRPREEMLVLFQDMAFMKKWQPGFQTLEVLEGNPGEVGSKSRLTYLSKGKPSEIIETIVSKDLPDRFDFLYEAKGVKNWARNRFIDQGDEVLWIAEHEFRFSGVMKVMGLLKGMFVKQTTKDMYAFKKFAEMESKSERSPV